VSICAVEGSELFYVEAGDGLPCLVMHGGLGYDHTYLHPWLDALGDRMRLIYYDHRGNGRSGRPPIETLTHDQLAADADALRRHLDLDRVAVMGQSYGGFIALEYALRYPERLSHLILIGTAPAFDYLEVVRANARRRGATEQMLRALEMVPDSDEAMAWKASTIGPLYWHAFNPPLAARAFGNTVYSASASSRARVLRQAYDVVARLPEIQAPTLITVGRDDFACPPAQAERLRAGIPRSELVVFERSGHFPYLEEPAAFFAAVRSWLSRVAEAE
jgi:proline iminopeptidase